MKAFIQKIKMSFAIFHSTAMWILFTLVWDGKRSDHFAQTHNPHILALYYLFLMCSCRTGTPFSSRRKGRKRRPRGDSAVARISERQSPRGAPLDRRKILLIHRTNTNRATKFWFSVFLTSPKYNISFPESSKDWGKSKMHFSWYPNHYYSKQLEVTHEISTVLCLSRGTFKGDSL